MCETTIGIGCGGSPRRGRVRSYGLALAIAAWGITAGPVCRAQAPAVAPAQPGKHGVDGLFSQTTIEYAGGGHLACKFYWFRADGHVYFAGRDPMPVVRGAGFSSLQASDPKNLGTYGINGDKITIQWNGQPPQTMSWTGDTMDGGVLDQVHNFAAGTRLEGTWASDVAIQGPGFSGAFASNSWTFHADGTVTNDSGSGVDSRGGVASSFNSTRGQYALNGTQLTITLAGTSHTYPILAVGGGAVPRILFLDGHVLSKQ